MEGRLVSRRLLCVLCLLPALTLAQLRSPALQEMMDVECAFIDMAERVDTRTAFLHFLSDSVVTNSPEGPFIGKERLLAQPANEHSLRWKIAFCDIASSGELGYTTGPWEYRISRSAEKAVASGTFHSIWRKEPDGVWRNILDIGVAHTDAVMDVKAMSSSIGPSRIRKKDLKRDGAATLNRLEVDFIDALREKGLAAYTEFGSQELRIARDGKSPFTTASERQSFVRGRNAYSTFHQLDCGLSGGGDLGYVYGTAEAVGPERNKPATYVRIWKREPGGWRIVVDVLTVGG